MLTHAPTPMSPLCFSPPGTWQSLLLAPGPLAGGEPAGPLLTPNIFNSNGFKSDSTCSILPCRLLQSLHHHHAPNSNFSIRFHFHSALCRTLREVGDQLSLSL